MLDIKFIRENLKDVQKMLARRQVAIDLRHILEIDDERKKLIQDVESRRHKRRTAAD